MNHAGTASGLHPERRGVPGSRTRQIIALLAWGPAGSSSRRSFTCTCGPAATTASRSSGRCSWPQDVVSIPLAVVLGVFRRLGLLAAGAALMAGTAVGLLLSAQIGLLGFKDSLAAPYAGLSLVVEFAGRACLPPVRCSSPPPGPHPLTAKRVARGQVSAVTAGPGARAGIARHAFECAWRHARIDGPRRGGDERTDRDGLRRPR